METIKKFTTITVTKNARSFQLCYCTKMHRLEGTDLWALKLGDAIAVNKSAKALLDKVPTNTELLNPPTVEDRWFLRGNRQDDGTILDPVVDWEGNLIETVKRGSRSLI